MEMFKYRYGENLASCQYDIRGNGGTAADILQLSTSTCGQLFVQVILPQHPLDRRLWEPQSGSRCSAYKKYLLLLQIKPVIRQNWLRLQKETWPNTGSTLTILLIKQQFVLTHTICQTKISTLLGKWVTKQNLVKKNSLHFHNKAYA